MKKIIIFDFDDTLFETARFKKEISKIFASYRVSAGLFKKTYQLSKGDKDYWQPEKQLDLLARNLPSIKKKRISTEIKSLFKQAGDFLYPDVRPFFKKIQPERKKQQVKLILMTYGNPTVQLSKISHCRLASFFDKIIMAQRPTKEKEILNILKKSGGKVIFIEDRGSVIDPLKRRHPKLVAFHIQRPSGRYHEKSQLADFKINSLIEGRKIIKKL